MTWSRTDLSVSPPSRQIADGDRETLGFAAGEAITGANATMRRLDTGVDVQGPVASGTTGNDPPIEAVTIASTTASVVVSGLTRGIDYELSVGFETAAGRQWTRTLVLEVVA